MFRRSLSEIFQLWSSCKDGRDGETGSLTVIVMIQLSFKFISCISSSVFVKPLTGKFTFFSIQDRIMTGYVGRIFERYGSQNRPIFSRGRRSKCWRDLLLVKSMVNQTLPAGVSLESELVWKSTVKKRIC